MITIKRIASDLKLDISTVSRALRDDEKISEKTKKKVKEYAKKVGYIPNIFASYLPKGKASLISLIVPDLKHPYYSEIFTQIEKKLGDKGYILQLFTTSFNEKNFEKVIEKSLSLRVSGLIIAYHKIEDLDIPFVLIDQEKIDGYDKVSIDNFYGAYEGVSYLINIGHKKIAYITDIYTTKEREYGYRKALKDNGIEINENLIIVRNGRCEEIGYNEGLRLLSMKIRPTAIFCGNDFVGIGVLKSAIKLNIKIPDQVSIIGFDDLPITSYLPIPLTTIRQPMEEISKFAIDILFKKMNNSEKKFPAKIIKPQLIIRDSTAPIYNNEKKYIRN
ncbi:MAG: LacI family transcriptional regulator [Candidatus Omnitrophica bacterium]|nr:LacI family transcriptional regulator [Candidatus Omnitrophota bacterium]